jgi:serine/threonine protein kinase
MYFRARPPETIIHRHGTSAVDIYQAGVTLYRAVNGEPVYEEQIACFDDAGLEAAILSGDFPNRQGYLPHVPLWIRKVLNKAMSIDPAKRFHSASDFMHDFGKRINLNWRTTFCGGGEIDWVADRRNRRSLLIRLRGSGNLWDVEQYTLHPDEGPRAQDKHVTWRRKHQRKAAIKYLRALFRSLERA